MISTSRDRYVEDLRIGDEVDLDGDEYGDNDNAIYNYAIITDLEDIYSDRQPWVRVSTSQGEFEMPAGHIIRVKVN